MLDYIELDLINVRSYPSEGYGTNTISRKLKEGRRVVPLDSKDLGKWLANIDDTQAMDVFNSAKPVSQTFEAWLRAACVAVSTNGKISQVQVEATALDPTTIPEVVWNSKRKLRT